LACAGAFATKKSALPLILLLVGYVIYRLMDKTIKWKHVLYIGLFFLVLIFIFQPFANNFDILNTLYAIGTDAGEARDFYWTKDYYYSVTDRLVALCDHISRFVSSPALYSLVLLVFSKKYVKLLIPAIGALMLLVLPYLISPEIPYYWFSPVFVLIYFLALIGVAGFVDFLEQILVNRLKINKIFFQVTAWSLVALLATGYIVQKHIPYYLSKYNIKTPNSEEATKWIEQNLLEKEYIVLERYYTFAIPKVYDRNDVKTSRATSRIFMYNRERNKFLSDIFRIYLKEHYYQNIGIDSVRGIKRIKYFNVNDSVALSSIKGKYFVTSQANYECYLGRTDSDLDDRLKRSLARMKRYYNFMLSQPLIKRFDEGSGTAIEIYHITGEKVDEAK